MRNVFLISILIIFLIIFSSEEAQTTQIESRNGRSNQEKIVVDLVKETRSNGEPKKCQIFREWMVNGRRVGCCTDDRSIPLTFCIDDQGLEVENYSKIFDYECLNPWECQFGEIN